MFNIVRQRCVVPAGTRSISFRNFPFALKSLPAVVESQWDSQEFKQYKDAFPNDATVNPQALISHVRELMSKDVKIGYLKSLQGYLWKKAYESGEIRAPLYDDVLPAFKRWKKRGITLAIYSSGSVDAQKLLFEHTDDSEESDIRSYLTDYFDTINAGSKTDEASYQKIAEYMDIDVGDYLFLSDNIKEVQAAERAGMKAAVVLRPGNAELSIEEKSAHEIVENGFGNLAI